jgi:hypothetical protein
MNEYERLIESVPAPVNRYSYGGRNDLTTQELIFCITVEEACKHFGVKDYSGVIALTLIFIGQPLISTRTKPVGATEGTSIASLVLRTLIDVNFKDSILPTLTNKSMLRLRFAMTRSLGGFIGRWVPQIGWTIGVYDVVKISVLSIKHYNQSVAPEDQLNDITTGSFG